MSTSDQDEPFPICKFLESSTHLLKLILQLATLSRSTNITYPLHIIRAMSADQCPLSSNTPRSLTILAYVTGYIQRTNAVAEFQRRGQPHFHIFARSRNGTRPIYLITFQPRGY